MAAGTRAWRVRRFPTAERVGDPAVSGVGRAGRSRRRSARSSRGASVAERVGARSTRSGRSPCRFTSFAPTVRTCSATSSSPAGFSGTRYVRAWQFRPGNRVVHHATIQMDTTGLSRRLDAGDDSPGYEGVVALTARAPDGFFLDWAPGHRPATAVEGTAWPLDGASDLVVMLHLKPSGKPEAVQASLGLYFSDTPPARLPVMLRLTRQDLDIARRRSRLRDDRRLQAAGRHHGHTVQPHAHYLGRHLEGSAQLAGRPRRAVDSDSRLELQLAGRLPLPEPIRCRRALASTCGTSTTTPTANPRNPHRPPRRVGYGQQTDDEMAELWFQVLARSETGSCGARQGSAREGAAGRDQGPPGHAGARSGERRAARRSSADADRCRPAERGGGRGRPLAALQPSSAAAHYNLGAALMAVGRMEQATGGVREGGGHRSRSRDGALQPRARDGCGRSRAGDPASAARAPTAPWLGRRPSRRSRGTSREARLANAPRR